jgi:hypothetical protein
LASHGAFASFVRGLKLARAPGLWRRVGQLLAEFHYRGFNGAVGENVQYLAQDVRGRELAVMVFGAAAWKVTLQDRFIGWSVEQRQQRLGAIANQHRFLILPWVRVAYLASHLPARATRRLSVGWQAHYCHPPESSYQSARRLFPTKRNRKR